MQSNVANVRHVLEMDWEVHFVSLCLIGLEYSGPHSVRSYGQDILSLYSYYFRRMNPTFQQALLAQCATLITEKIKQIQTSLDLSQDSLVSDTKSSAGDKYETSREMIQQDLDRLQGQLREAKKDQQLLQSIGSLPPSKEQRVRLGSLVKTEMGWYFLSIGIGKVNCLDQTVFVVSLQSPIGQLLLGKAVGENFSFQQKAQIILDIH